MKYYKRYVDVVSFQTKEGKIKPLFICWDDGHKYTVDKCQYKGQRASEVGGCGLLFICMIEGRQRNLFYEKNERWFIESVHP